MRAMVLGFIAASFVAAVSAPVRCHAQQLDEPPEPSYRKLVEQVANTSIIWVTDEYRKNHPEIAAIATDFATRYQSSPQNKDKIVPKTVALYDNLNGFSVELSKAEADALVDELANSSSSSDKELAAGVSVTPDMIVSIFDDEDCDDTTAKDLSQIPGGAARFRPPGVERVNGGGNTTAFSKRVWVIDTGLDNSGNFITVDASKAANCTGGQCTTSSAGTFGNLLKDQNGHGTMVAGIIAAHELIDNNPANDSDPSIIGVAPGATVIPVKAFRRNPDASLANGPLRAVEYVLSNASIGDVVNISWGSDWLEGMNRRRNNLETVMGAPNNNPGLRQRLRQLVNNKNIKVAVAAGNIEPAVRPSWVQFVMPAGLGSYPTSGAGCKICTVSAVESRKVSGTWIDRFWWDPPTGTAPGATGRWGSNYGVNPPDFAEPGVGILSLWPSGGSSANMINMCSGTSFAAPHLAGILVRGTPAPQPTVIGDPDSPNDPSKADPLGVLP